MGELSVDARRAMVWLRAGPKSDIELIEALDMQPSVLRRCMEDLLARDLVHIVALQRERGKNRLIPTYAAGSKVRYLAKRKRVKSVARMEAPAR